MGEIKVIGLTDIDNQPILEQSQPDVSKAGNTTDAVVSFPVNQGVTTPQVTGTNISRSSVFDIGSMTEYIHIDGANRIIQSSNYIAGLSGWIIRGDGSVEFSDGVFRGSITATSGTIGGFDIGSNYIRDVANSFGLSSAVTGGNDPRFWAGTTLANIATAPVRIYEDGSMVATNIEATGAIYAESGWIGAPTALITEAEGINTGTTGWIRGGQTGFNTGTGYFLGYSGGDYKFSIGGSKKYVKWDGNELEIRGTNSVSKIMIAGRAITAGQSVIIGNGTDQYLEASATDFAGTYEFFDDNDWYAQSFLTSSRAVSIKKISIYGNRASSLPSPPNVTVSIRAVSGGLPTGADIESKTATVGSNSSTGWLDLTFSSPVTVSPSTEYALILRTDNTAGYNWQESIAGYPSGSASSSSNSGSTWSSDTGDVTFRIYEIETVSGKVYASKASQSGDLSNNFIGFAAETASANTEIPIIIAGSDDNQTGLTVAAPYYLSDTEGAISTTPGTVSKKVGISLSTTELLILNT